MMNNKTTKGIGSGKLFVVSIVLISFVFPSMFPPTQTLIVLNNPNATTITIDPSSATILGCDMLEINIWINDVVDLYGADIQLAFDASVLQVVDADPGKAGVQIESGGFLAGSLYIVYNTADNTAGTIRYAATQLNPTPPTSGSGILFKVKFIAISASISPIQFTYAKLADRDGNEIFATPVDDSITTYAPAAPDLSIEKLNATTARLSWSSPSGITNYQLYRGTTPYFTPVDPPYQTLSAQFFDDVNALGNVDTNYYYVVTGTCSHGFISEISNRVGEYDFKFSNTSLANYNDLSLVFDTTVIQNSEDLASYIGASVIQVMRFDLSTQTFQIYDPGDSATNFDIATGDYIFVVTDNSSPTIVSLVGNVPDPGSISFQLASSDPPSHTFLSLPLDRSDILSASDVAADIGGGVIYVMRYRTETQTFQTYIPEDTATDFPLAIGEPFVLVLSLGAPLFWP